MSPTERLLTARGPWTRRVAALVAPVMLLAGNAEPARPFAPARASVLVTPESPVAPAPAPGPVAPVVDLGVSSVGDVLGEIDDDGRIPDDLLARVRAERPDVLVILGARVRRGVPGRHLTQRMETAFRLWEALDRRPALLLSGGKGEAYAMRDHLLARGVPRAQMILETRSRTTAQNARFSMRILERRAPLYRTALLVTTAVRRRRRIDDHARRALMSFAFHGRTVRVSAISVNEDPDIAPRVYGTADVRVRRPAHHRRRHGRRGGSA